MLSGKQAIKKFRVPPGEEFRLADHDPAWTGDNSVPKAERKRAAKDHLAEEVAELASAQEKLYAADSWSLLVILQALDAAGKDSVIKHVMSGVNPQGCQVFSFKKPSDEELDHTFLWRCMKALPERGRIGIFNRSYYEEVLVVRVHPELVVRQRIPGADPRRDTFWQERFEDINAFERHLVRNGTAVIKFFLNVSKEAQRERLLARIEDPEKHWKVSALDVSERAHWEDYMAAYEACLQATSTAWAPWYVIPADHKWVTRTLVATILTETIDVLDLQWPTIGEDQEDHVEQARKTLAEEQN